MHVQKQRTGDNRFAAIFFAWGVEICPACDQFLYRFKVSIFAASRNCLSSFFIVKA